MINEYKKLDRRVQKWLFKQGWTELREIQAKALQPIMSGNSDVLISASTAAGKTEAFFLPACTVIAEQEEGFGILYVSPLKALINDQYRRLEDLCEMLDMKVTPWHGDSLQSMKKKTIANPSGILLITPESLESLLVRDPGWIKKSFSELKYICIDEFHAFIGAERGRHLLSLLNRLEHLLGRLDDPIPRVALSATLGELEAVPRLLRPNASMPCSTITSSENHSTLKVQIKGYVDPADPLVDGTKEPAEFQVCKEIYRRCRGGSHLVFANSRKRTESIAAQLADFSEEDVVPNEFFPHHGSLSKELREELEARLQKATLPTTAICTMTLELGIDIGKVQSVIQVTAPHSVSSLRQRLGRSGRRNSPAILSMLITEKELSMHSNILDNLRLELVQSLAMMRLLIISNWFEPADNSQFYFSTFLHQILAVIAQWGSIRVDQLYSILCGHGPFGTITPSYYKELLSHMSSKLLIQQLESGELVIGISGEHITSSYKFYSVFKTPEEYRVVVSNKTLGTLPVDSLILKDQHIVFGGRRWKVEDIDEIKKIIYVVASKGGRPPRFGGGGMSVHNVVRQEMFNIYKNGDYRISVGSQKIDFLDTTARQLFREGAEFFASSDMAQQSIVQTGKDCYLLTWMGDRVVNTLHMLLVREGFQASVFAGVIEVRDVSTKTLSETLLGLIDSALPPEEELAEILPIEQKQIEKYDHLLPENLLSVGFGRRVFDIAGAKGWLLGWKAHT